MNKIVGTLLAISATIYAGGNTSGSEAKSNSITIEDSTSYGLFSTYGFGGSKITLGDEYHKAFVISSKTGYKFENDVSIYMLGESNYYRHVGDINEMGISGLAIGYDVPYTNNKLSLAVTGGLGTNINYNRLFKKFRESYDFGFAYRANIDYKISENLNINVSYSKFDFNTNATNLEDTEPEIIGVNIAYRFDAKTFLD